MCYIFEAVNKIRCFGCGDIVFSQHNGNAVACSCGKISVQESKKSFIITGEYGAYEIL